ncbi:S8 family serine peptidase [Mangrovivirga cuniculi]|uniref:F5/8 type C domain-containing protein n=1 Tax=Mangrovivirga cuniculi TaxID=2715131 RepID=A0A4D7K0R0_9BACT|nr:S8 family serine peptidase [Mangrovivirga cuniculi]QCK16515.1 hypothetical protein DCC35_18145 [Mangrovivirga cuniculi]
MKNFTLPGVEAKSLYLLIILLVFNLNLSAQQHCKTGMVTIKVTEEVASQLNETLRNMSETVVQTGNPEIDKLSSEYSCQKITRLFPFNPRFDQKHRKYGLHQWFTLRIDEGASIEDVVKSYEGLEYVEIAEPVMIPDYEEPVESLIDYSEAGTLPQGTNDPLFHLQYSFENTTMNDGGDVGILPTWKQNTGNKAVIVAVIDGGIEKTHPDLKQNLWVNEDEIPNNGIDDDNNGYKDDYNGYGFGERKGDYTPDGHGTHVGGTVGASSNNGIGVAGLAGGSGDKPGVQLMSCATFSPNGNGGFQESFIYAADNGAVIAQNSWSFRTPNIYLPSYEVAINYFINEAGKDEFGNQVGPMAGGLVMFSAGNSNTKERIFPSYLDQVIAVAATDNEDKRAGFSNYGDWVDISAPGVSIASTYINNSYAYSSGTSMSCPHVSGVAALMVSAFGKQGFTPEKVKALMYSSADNIDARNPDFVGSLGWGRLNAQKGFKASVNRGAILSFQFEELILEDIYFGTSKPISLVVGNLGLEQLNISKIESESGVFKKIKFNKSPLRSFFRTEINFEFIPNASGPFSEKLMIYSNDENDPVKEIIVSGNVLSAPILTLNDFYEDVVIDNSTIDEFRFDFKNTGNVKLTYKLSLVGPQGDGYPINTIVNITGETPVNTEDQVRMKIDARGVPRGTYNYGVRFETNEPVDNVDTLFFDVKVLGPELVVLSEKSSISVNKGVDKEFSFGVKNIGELPAKPSVIHQPGGYGFGDEKVFYSNGFEKLSLDETTPIEIYNSGKAIVSDEHPFEGEKHLRVFELSEYDQYRMPLNELNPYVYANPTMVKINMRIVGDNPWSVEFVDDNWPGAYAYFDPSDGSLEFYYLYDNYQAETITIPNAFVPGEYFELAVTNFEGSFQKLLINGKVVAKLQTFFGVSKLYLTSTYNGDGYVDIDNYINVYGGYRTSDYSFLDFEFPASINPGEEALVTGKINTENATSGVFYKDIFMLSGNKPSLSHTAKIELFDDEKIEVSPTEIYQKVYFNNDTLRYVDVENTGGKDLWVNMNFSDQFDQSDKKETVVLYQQFQSLFSFDAWYFIDNSGSGIVWGTQSDHGQEIPDNLKCIEFSYGSGLWYSDIIEGAVGDLDTEVISPEVIVNTNEVTVSYLTTHGNGLGGNVMDLDISYDNGQTWNNVLRWDDYRVRHECERVEVDLKPILGEERKFKLRWHSYGIGYASEGYLDEIKIVAKESALVSNNSGGVFLPIGAIKTFPLSINSTDVKDGDYLVKSEVITSGEEFSQNFDLNIEVLGPGIPIIDQSYFDFSIGHGTDVSQQVIITNKGQSPVKLDFEYNLPPEAKLNFKEEILSEDFDDLETGAIKQKHEIIANDRVIIDNIDPYTPNNHLVMKATGSIRSEVYPTIEYPTDSVSSFSMFIKTDLINYAWYLSTNNNNSRIFTEDIEFGSRSLSIDNEKLLEYGDEKGYKHIVLTYNKTTKENKIYYNGKLIKTILDYRQPIFYFNFANRYLIEDTDEAKIDNIELINGKPKFPIVRSETQILNLNPGESKPVNLIVDAGRLNIGEFNEILKASYMGYELESLDINFDFEVIDEPCKINSKTNQTMTGNVSASSFASEWQIANRAADGLPYTKWHSTFDTEQYYDVDLGKVNMIDSVRILWDYNYASSFDILVRSSKSEEWTKWYSKINNTEQLTELSLTQINARYVRLKLNSPATVFGYSLFEFELFGGCAEGDPILTTIDITPEYYSLAPGEELQYQFTAKDQFGKEYIPSNATWGASGNVNIDSETGVLTGLMDGEYEVTLTADGITKSVAGSVVSNGCSVSLVGSLSLNKPSVASSEESLIFEAEMANDGNLKSDWRSKFADNQWWYVELGDTYNIHEINIDWGVNFATWYELQYRDSDGIWRVFYKDLSADGGNDQIDFDGSVSTDAIRLWSFTRSGPWGFNINEIEVYGVCTPSTESASMMNMAVLAYPNPPQDVVNLKVNNNKDGLWTVELYDSQYNSYGSSEVMLNSDDFAELPFKFGGLYRGTYFLKLTDYDGEVTVLKILKE